MLIEGDRATSLSYARVYHVGSGDHEGSFFECMGEYEDSWEFVDGAWRLQSRTFPVRISLGDISVLKPAHA